MTKTPTSKTTNFATTLRICREQGYPDLTGKRLTPNCRYNILKSLSVLLTGLGEPPPAPEPAEDSPPEGGGMAAWRRIGKLRHDSEALGERALLSFMQREVRQQHNREAIARLAADLLTGGKPARKDSPREIEDDWLTIFSEVAGHKSDRDIQRMLARMLVGEIRKPGSFSPAAIHTAGLLTRKTAGQFRQFCNLTLRSTGISFVITSPWPDFRTKGEPDLGVKYQDLLDLQCAGLISPSLTSNLDLNAYLNKAAFDMADRSIVFTQTQLPPPKPPGLDIILLSPVGHELRQIIDLTAVEDYANRLVEWFGERGISLSTLT